jgi:hypothetical protein
MNNTRILVVGYGRAGKDTAAHLLEKITGIPYAGSTSWAAKEYMARKLGVHPQVAWETRHQHRELWKRLLDEARESDQTLLIRWALESVNEDRSSGILAGWRGICAGVRDRAELLAAKEQKIFHHILWIHRAGTPVDPTVTFTCEDCDTVILNHGNLDDLRHLLFSWAEKKGLVPGLYLSGKCPTTDIHRE